MTDPARRIVTALDTLDGPTRAQLAEGLSESEEPFLRVLGHALDAVGPKLATLIIGAALRDAEVAGKLPAVAALFPDSGMWGEVRAAVTDYAAHPPTVNIAPDR